MYTVTCEQDKRLTDPLAGGILLGITDHILGYVVMLAQGKQATDFKLLFIFRYVVHVCMCQ